MSRSVEWAPRALALFAATLALALAAVAVLPLRAKGIREQATGPHRFGFADARALKGLGAVTISSNGRLGALESGGTVQVWQLAEPSRLVAEFPGSSPLFSPDGAAIAYYCDEHGRRQLCTWQQGTGARVLTRFPAGLSVAPYTLSSKSLSWSPDSHQIAFVAREPVGRTESAREPDPLVLTAHSPFLRAYEGIYRFEERLIVGDSNGPTFDQVAQSPAAGLNRLFVVQTDGTDPVQLDNSGPQFFNPAWSPDGRVIAVVADRTRAVDPPGPAATDLILIDARTGHEVPLQAPFAAVGAVVWRPDGRQLAAVGRGAYADWGEFGSLQIWNADTHRWTGVDELKDRSVRDAWWVRDDLMVARVDDRFSDSLLLLDPATGKTTPVSLAPWVLESLDIASTGHMLFAAQTAQWPSRAFTRSLSGTSTPRLILDPNPQLADVKLGVQERLTWIGGAKQAHDGVYIVPPDYRPGMRYPLLVDVYPEAVRDRFHAGAAGLELGQLQAAWGDVVLMASPRGSVSRLYDFSRGKQAVEVASGARGKAIAVEDVLGGIRALSAKGLVDDRRVCIFGHSNGGYIANVLATEAPRSARCVIVSAGYSELAHAYFNEPTHAWSQGFAQADLLSSPQTYIELSPIFRMGAVRSRMLLVDGDADWLPFLPQMLMEYNALKSAGKDVQFLRYPAEGHVFSRPDHIEDKLDRMRRFIEESLAPSAPGFLLGPDAVSR